MTDRQKQPDVRLVPARQRRLYMLILALAVLAYVLSLFQLKLEFFGGFETLKKAASFIFKMLTVNFTDWRDVLYAAFQSICVAVLATIISALCAFFLGFFAATNVSVKGLSWFLKALASAIRAIPTIIWALIFVAFLGFGPFAGMLGLFFHSFAYLVKAYSQSIEDVSPGSIEAMKATGASWITIMARGVVPSIKTNVIAWTALRLEFNIGQSSILGLVGAGGIGHELSLDMRNFDFERGGLVVLVIFIMSFSVEMTFNKLKLNLDKKLLKE